MILKSTTCIDEKVLRDIICAAVKFWRQHLGVPFYMKNIRKAQIRNRSGSTSGRAYWHERRFVASVGHTDWSCQHDCRMWCGRKKDYYTKFTIKRHVAVDEERLEMLTQVIAHEVGHLAVHFAEDNHGRAYSRNRGKSTGGDEEYIDRMAWKFVDGLTPAL